MVKRVSLILVAIATLIGLLYLADIGLLVGLLETLSPSTLALLIGIFFVGSVVKGLRWAFYLRSAHLNIRWRDGLTSSMAGMTTTPLPGGSWLAPRLAQEHGEVRMRQAAPALFISFIADAITIPALVLVLFLATDRPRFSIVIPIIGITLGLVLVAMGRSIRVWNLVASILNRSRFTRRWLPKGLDVQMRVRAMMRPRVLLGGIAFSLVTTLTAVAFLLVLVNALVFRDIGFENAFWVHTVTETAAIALPVPGGFGVTDSSIAGLLSQQGIGLRRATFIAIALRSIDAGMRVFFGTVFLFLRYDRFLLDTLDVRGRTRKAYRRAITIPGIKQTLAPVVNAILARVTEPIVEIVDAQPIEKASAGD